MHWSQALSKSHTQPILMPRTPPWREAAAMSLPQPSELGGGRVTNRQVILLHSLGGGLRGRKKSDLSVTCCLLKYCSSGWQPSSL